RRGASLGANSTIVCGTEVGPYSCVGAGAVVTHPVPAYALVVGVPARVIGYVCRCGERLQGEGAVACADCGATYTIGAEGCEERNQR
ncbi:MAG: hypothetical protein RL701_5912, partial [Pseudomonadota bacterium]